MRQEVIDAGVSQIQAGQAQAINDGVAAVYDKALAEGVASVPVQSGGGFNQDDIDKAVADARAVDAQAMNDLQAADQKDAADAKAASDAAMADLQAKMDALAAAKGQEDGVISGLQGSLKSLQDAVAALAGLIPSGQ